MFVPVRVKLQVKVQICDTPGEGWEVCLPSLQPIPNFKSAVTLGAQKWSFGRKIIFV